MARLTRTESQTRNRDQVMAAARRLFLRDGYQATSLAAIAEEAGFSTGVVYSNFAGKSELAVQVLRAIQAEQAAVLATAMTGEDPLGAKIDAIEAWAESAFDSGWARLELEFALDARTDPDLVAQEAQRHDAAIDQFATTLAQLVPPAFAAFVPARAVAGALLNVAYGVAVRRTIDPSVTAERELKPLRDVLRSLGLLAS
ncbi:TetR/AcrR family transcriptional regulator [Nocardioides humilatus]|uniref:TetR/AcrR family transcriptional regulator n=1 Tax=Nocardioides humilatus TaxID=2607660 RepID=A0A5B1LIF9_9ACTN|nr:TetR/AcrR family transcriptional regulator [Nocardioides humilatus]KAA1420226.1 TetR/AcrR family transcriptional regulator [Nocardioides humilatus]